MLVRQLRMLLCFTQSLQSRSALKRRPRASSLSRVTARIIAMLALVVCIGMVMVVPAPSVAAAATAGCTWHTVVPGDTLGNLGWSHHTTAAAIARANHIADPNLIYVGQSLCIPLHSASLATAPQCIWHAVIPGDTLGALGSQYRRDVPTLAHSNHIANPNRIFVGQLLCIPEAAGGSATTTDPPDTAPPQSAPASSDPSSQSTSVPVVIAPVLNGGSAIGVQAFIQLALPYARAAHTATGWPTSLILAQWGIEQGWHVPSYTGYNFGNCGAVPGEPLVPGLKVPGSPAAFAYAPTPQDGLRIYVEVAHLSFYAAVSPAAHHGVDAAARALGESPWDAAHYSVPGGGPGSSLIAVLHAYNLYQYDAR